MPNLLTHPHQRRFGVEIECGFPGGMREVQRRVLGWPDHVWQQDGWSIGSDGSGVELRTPPLKGKKGFETLRDMMRRLKEAGAFVTEADGMHVHHEAPEFVASSKLCAQLVESWVNNEDTIFSMVANRRRDGGPCPAWTDYNVQALKSVADGTEVEGEAIGLDRNDLNLLALGAHGTIEIRLHEGTLDEDVAQAWVMFGQRLLHEVLKRAKPLSRSTTDVSLLSRIKMSGEARKVLLAKKAANHLTAGAKFRSRQGASSYDAVDSYIDDRGNRVHVNYMGHTVRIDPPSTSASQPGF